MKSVREILRQKWELGHSHRKVAASLNISVGVITKVLKRAAREGLDSETIKAVNDSDLASKIYGKGAEAGKRPMPDPLWIHLERKKRGVTLELLHLEYLEEHPDGYRYTQFCEHYRRWVKKSKLSMRQVHKAGEKLFIDYSGDKPHYKDPSTGENVYCEFFVATMGASSYTFAEATRTQKSPEFIGSNVRALEFFGGVPELLVPDQMRTAVSRPCWYEPGTQRTYSDLAVHYDCTVLPARPRHPKDKAKVESAVRFTQRWILARMRNETLFSIDELNDRIESLLQILNDKPRPEHGGQSRRELFEKLDKPALRALPRKRFVYAEWKKAKVNIDYHIDIEKRFYSVPFSLVREIVDVRITAATVEIFFNGNRVASHQRSHKIGAYRTTDEHMPKAHLEHANWTPSALIHWGERIGPSTGELISKILNRWKHPEQGYRSCLGLRSLAKRYGEERLEAAARRALRHRAIAYRHIKNILKNGLDQLEEQEENVQKPVVHENIRGPGYYNGEE